MADDINGTAVKPSPSPSNWLQRTETYVLLLFLEAANSNKTRMRHCRRCRSRRADRVGGKNRVSKSDGGVKVIYSTRNRKTRDKV